MTNEEFWDRLQSLKDEHQLSEDDIAGACYAARTTVRRWLERTAAPVSCAKDSVFIALRQLLAEKAS